MHRLIVGNDIKAGHIGISVYHPIKITNSTVNPAVAF